MARTSQSRHPLRRRMGTRGQPKESRAAILQAAAQEFADHGVAGARTDAIARTARVNKALLYYYFNDKETLYGAVLDNAFSGLKNAVFQALDGDLPPRDKIMAYAGAYFDFIASNHLYPRLMQREMMRAREGQSPHIDKVIKSYIRPIFMRVSEVMTRGVECIHPDATLQEAAAKMKSLDIGPLPVCDNDRLVGMVTDRDITIR